MKKYEKQREKEVTVKRQPRKDAFHLLKLTLKKDTLIIDPKDEKYDMIE